MQAFFMLYCQCTLTLPLQNRKALVAFVHQTIRQGDCEVGG